MRYPIRCLTTAGAESRLKPSMNRSIIIGYRARPGSSLPGNSVQSSHAAGYMTLAISEAIHAALVGGTMTAAVVVFAVVGEAWIVRLQERRAGIEAAVMELARLLPRVVVPISEMWIEDETHETGPFSPWAAEREQVDQLLQSVVQKARWPMRRSRAIKGAARDLQARFAAATHLWNIGRHRTTMDEYTQMLPNELHGLVFGKSQPVDDLFARYVSDARSAEGS
jgi:hypothetical protein